ncbi:MAG TPA: WD40 repeat domain-containing protein [Elusimicrobiales bacterium]|nr:WD40 repeat domain-containing protein [Elusimicrobiales bacterium]
MTKTVAAAILFFSAQLLCPAASSAGVITRELKLFPQGFPGQLRLARETPFLVCVSSPGKIAVIDVALGAIAASFPSPAESAAISPDGRILAVAASSASVILYAPPSWEPYGKLKADSPGSLEFSPDGGLLAVGSLTDAVYLFQFPAMERVDTLAVGGDGPAQPVKIAFSPDGRFFAAAGGAKGGAWDTFDWHKIDDFKAPAAVPDLYFSYDSKYLVSAPLVYEVLPKKVKKAKLREGEERFLAARLLKEKNLLVVPEHGAMLLFDAGTRISTGTLVSFPGEISESGFSADGKFLAAAAPAAGTLYLTALEESAGLFGLSVDEGQALFARGKYAEALAKFLAAKKLQDTPEINGKIAEAGYLVSEKASDAAAAAGRYDAAIAEMRAALKYRPNREGKKKLAALVSKLNSGGFSALLAKAGELEEKYEYGAAADTLLEALKLKADAKTAARAKKLARQERVAAKYRREFARGSRALKKQDYEAAVELFTKAVKLIDTPEARKALQEAQDNFRR